MRTARASPRSAAGSRAAIPAAIFLTTGPGITNVLTSLEAARAAGARFVVLTPLTPATESGKFGIQDTGLGGYFNPDLYRPGRLFDSVTVLESTAQLPELGGRLAAGFAGAGAYSAHIAIPTTLQTAPVEFARELPVHRRPAPAPTPALADEIVDLLAAEPFSVWAGRGAGASAENDPPPARPHRRAGYLLARGPWGSSIATRSSLACRATAAARRCSRTSRAPGRGVCWCSARRWARPRRAGTPRLVPEGGLIHVDLDANVFGRSYPLADTLAVQSGIGEFLAAVLARAARLVRREPITRSAPARLALVADDAEEVHPRALMAAIQRVVIDRTDAPVIADASSAMFWAARLPALRRARRLLDRGSLGLDGFRGRRGGRRRLRARRRRRWRSAATPPCTCRTRSPPLCATASRRSGSCSTTPGSGSCATGCAATAGCCTTATTRTRTSRRWPRPSRPQAVRVTRADELDAALEDRDRRRLPVRRRRGDRPGGRPADRGAYQALT